MPKPKLMLTQTTPTQAHLTSSFSDHNFPPTPREIEAAGTAATMAKRSLAVAPVLLAVAALLLLASCHGRELKHNGAGAAGSVAGVRGGGGGVGDEKTLLGLPVPSLPLVPPVTGVPLIPGNPPAARASTDNKKQSP
jgi:hypothetical protein